LFFKVMKADVSIFSKILLWFFLNLVILAVIFLIFFQIRFHVPPGSVLAGGTSYKTISLYRMIRHELNTAPRARWDSLLERYGRDFEADLVLVSMNGCRIAGSKLDIPGELKDKIRIWHNRFRPLESPGPERGYGMGRRHKFTGVLRARTTDPVCYWLGLPLPLIDRIHRHAMPAMLLIRIDSLIDSGFFPDLKPALVGALVIVVVSLLWWFPMVRHITRPLKLMTAATEEVADGRFDIRVDDRRSDEIGRLGRSINIMSERLENFITGRKRFLGDIAHELCSPLARLKMGLGILENRLGPEDSRYLKNVSEEADNMAELINEILSFSRAELSPDKMLLAGIDIRTVVDRVIERERQPAAGLTTDIEPGIKAVCNQDLLARALSNLVRNALVHGGSQCPVNITAHRHGKNILIQVADSGPGIPEEYINRIFDPFFRVEAHRSRDTGGAGLGLAIVKTCIEACRGRVWAENRREGGLIVFIELPAAGSANRN
jgi:two-component system sensor histidine kinase CpxA